MSLTGGHVNQRPGQNERLKSAFEKYRKIRATTEELCRGLHTEDYVVQSAFEVSPVKWHLAHTTWFFETFILKPYKLRYHPFSDAFAYLFNSYYETVGEYFPKERRGTLSRPTVDEVYKYRQHVDEAMEELMSQESINSSVLERMIVGINHEQQHQELMLMDIKYNFYSNPLKPAYADYKAYPERKAGAMEWIHHDGGIAEIGHQGSSFSFDNETPRHRKYLEPFSIASRLVTNREYLEFIDDGGYRKAEYWLADGWHKINGQGWEAPLYWEEKDDEWYIFTLSGMRMMDPEEPVSHISFYEALAFAHWKGARLPTEEEWETAMNAIQPSAEDNFAESGYYRPIPPRSNNGMSQGYGDLWEWTYSPYVPYPGNKPLAGSLGEYNVKFMANQMVLRGGCCATPSSHIRKTYRNFFHLHNRWPFTGIRLAADE